MDWYAFLDEVLLHEADRLVTIHHLSAQAPYTRDHFPGRPVLPGVLVLEAMIQAGRKLLADRVPDAQRWVLGSAKALRLNRFLQPGQWLACDVRLIGLDEGDAPGARLSANVLALDQRPRHAQALDLASQAAACRLVLRPVTLPDAADASRGHDRQATPGDPQARARLRSTGG